jgi:hypothetical protein
MSSQGIMPFGAKDRGVHGEVLIKVVASVLDELIATPPQRTDEPLPVTKFHGLRAPSIAISDYLSRISKFSGCSVRSIYWGLGFQEEATNISNRTNALCWP